MHKLAKIEKIKDRFFNLTKNYIIKAINLYNPLILECIKDFKNYANGRILKHQTIICPFKLQIEEAIKAKK